MKGAIFLVFFVIAGTNIIQCSLQEEKFDWWQRAIFYQIFPRSFKDSNGDGIGDLKGISEKMDFFTDLGVQAIWLSPIYTSPMVDGGYDVSNYSDISPDYGTLDDFKELLTEAHSRGLKVILDFVPNHTSDEHEWFIKSVNREKGYEDYYVWENCTKNENGSITYPSNWLSVWGGSMWAWNDTRKQCYLHQFSDKQPDLNFRNSKIHDEMEKIMTYWLDMGVDGFRVDAVPHLFENASLPDEPINANSGLPEDNYNYLQHIYTKDQPESKELIYEWREFIDNYTTSHGGDTRIMMTEAATDLDNSVTYYGTKNGSRLGAHFSFNFWLVGMTDKSRPSKIYDDIEAWTNALPKYATQNWLTGNHDNPRIASTVKPRNVDGYNMLLAFLDAVSITYMGEEIGMENGEVTCAQGKDPSAIKNCTTFNTTSRDFERTPYQWDDSAHAGFTNGSSTWLPVSSKYKQTNLKLEMQQNRSHYHVYRTLAKLKKELSNKQQSAIVLVKSDDNKDLLQINRILDNKTYTMAFNMGESKLMVLLAVNVTNNNTLIQSEVLAASVNASYDVGQIISGLQVRLNPGDSIILRIPAETNGSSFAKILTWLFNVIGLVNVFLSRLN